MKLDKKQNRLRRARKSRAKIRQLAVNRLSIHPSPNQPAVPAVSVWKIATLVSAATAIVLAGIILRRGPERREETAATNKQVESVVRDYLTRGETAKAAAVLERLGGGTTSLYLEVAAASLPAEAAKLLDPIDLATEESSVAEAVASARFDAYRVLFETRVLEDGMLR